MIGVIIGGSILAAAILAHGYFLKNRPIASQKLPIKREVESKIMKKSPEPVKQKEINSSDTKNLEK